MALAGCPRPKPESPSPTEASRTPCTYERATDSDQAMVVATSTDDATAVRLTDRSHIDIPARTTQVFRSVDRGGRNIFNVGKAQVRLL